MLVPQWSRYTLGILNLGLKKKRGLLFTPIVRLVLARTLKDSQNPTVISARSSRVPNTFFEALPLLLDMAAYRGASGGDRLGASRQPRRETSPHPRTVWGIGQPHAARMATVRRPPRSTTLRPKGSKTTEFYTRHFFCNCVFLSGIVLSEFRGGGSIPDSCNTAVPIRYPEWESTV